MDAIDFTHQEFCASDWENKLKEFIASLDCSDNIIWHRKREHKKINEELATLGYYVKYKYGKPENITFKLNKDQGKADGWIYDCGKKVETVQIAIAYYEQEEAEIDKRIMNGEDVVEGGWVGDRIEVLKSRIEERTEKKTNMNYEDIDTLLIGLRDWFVKRINNEYHEQKNSVVCNVESCVPNCTFKQIALVDTNYVGKGELLIIPNLALNSDG